MNKIRFTSKKIGSVALPLGGEDPTGTSVGVPHTIQRGNRNCNAQEGSGAAEEICAVGLECYDLNG